MIAESDALGYKYKGCEVPWGFKYQSRTVGGIDRSNEQMDRNSWASSSRESVVLQYLIYGARGFVSAERTLLSSQLTTGEGNRPGIVCGLARQTLRH